MPRKPTTDAEFGSDSFLDVVANLVGILIILVVVAGLRIQHLPAQEEQSAGELDFAQPQAALRNLENELGQLTSQAADLQLAAAQEQAQTLDLAAALAAQRQELESRRQLLDAQARQELDAQRDLLTAQSLAQQLQQDLQQTSSVKKTVTVENYPTPLARTVDGDEQHFQLRSGRIAYIPVEDLLKLLKSEAPSQLWKLKDLPEATATVGPLRGFRMRYTFERVDVPLDDQLAGKRFIGSFAQLSQWSLVPSDNQLGETLQEALGPQSEFHAILAKQNPRDCTITLWTYPDSFQEFRRLKKELYLMGFAIAGRPLPADSPISGSPRGSKSAAQ